MNVLWVYQCLVKMEFEAIHGQMGEKTLFVAFRDSFKTYGVEFEQIQSRACSLQSSAAAPEFYTE